MDNNTNKYLSGRASQMFILCALVLILLVLLGGYIYIGMKQAGTDQTAETVPDAAEGTWEERNQAIIEALNNSSTSESVSEEDRTAIYSALENAEPVNNEKAQIIIENLQ